MYFITDKDPDYTIKGSRDPLGFQVIWQAAGRRVIPHLSTVSSTIRDFQILAIAHALKKELDIADPAFEPFFLRLEQIMAYTRFLHYKDESFNGIERVKRKIGDSRFHISTKAEDQLLSSQKAYGIWGKYIRPFTDIGIAMHEGFENVYFPKIRGVNMLLRQAKTLRSKPPDERYTILKDSLDNFTGLLARPTGAEQQLLTECLLQDNHEGELLRITTEMNGFKGNLQLYPLIDTLIDESDNGAFCTSLEHIRQTEKVLSPLSRIFRYLQLRSFWSYDEIAADKNIANWRTTPVTTFLQGPCRALAALMRLSNADLVKQLVARNEEVARWRHSAPWMRLTAAGLEVNHYEGAGSDPEYDPETWSDNTYFLLTFINLYRQLN